MTRVLVATTAALSLTAAACGDDDNDTAASTASAADTGTGSGTSAAAADLRAGLTSLVQEHVYLAGIAISTGVTTGLDSPATQAPVGTLDANSVALSQAVGSVYGADAEQSFLTLWRNHIGLFAGV